ncbi:MAG TPA: hypothetical protein DDY88_03730 [Actinobacteria bacterium]|nr:hypothetical protein [Actinomycetota bacterium]
MGSAGTSAGKVFGGGMLSSARSFAAPLASVFAVGTVAAGAFAVKLGVDGVKAAIDDEASVSRLSQAMKNLGLANEDAGVQKMIDDLQFQTGVADDELRPAMQKLLTATGDVTKAQSLLSVAMDVSAGANKDLESVTQALARASGGQFTALTRLGVPLDANIIKSKDLGAATQALSEKFGGQAATAADTYAGKLKRLGIAGDEMKESFGVGILDGFTKALGGTDKGVDGLTGSLKDARPQAEALGKAVGQLGAQLVIVGQFTGGFIGWLDSLGGTLPVTGAHISALTGSIGLLTSAWGELLAIKGDVDKPALTKGQLAGLPEGFFGSTDKGRAAKAKKDRAAMLKNIGLDDVDFTPPGGSSGGSAAAKQVEAMRLMWSALATDASTGLDALNLIIQGKSQTISGAMVDTFDKRFQVFKGIVSAQSAIITDARKSLDDYSASVVDTIMGKIDFGLTNAEGNPLTPEQIVTMMLGDITNQAATVQALANSGVMTNLPNALSQKILAMPPDAAVGLANYLSANPALITQLTTNYNALGTTTETLLGIPMAAAFAKVGNESAVSMIAAAKAKIATESDKFQAWVSKHLDSKVFVDVVYRDINKPGGATINIDGARAAGGPIKAGNTYLTSEHGPELFVAGSDGYMFPNSSLGSAASSQRAAAVVDSQPADTAVLEELRRLSEKWDISIDRQVSLKRQGAI